MQGSACRLFTLIGIELQTSSRCFFDTGLKGDVYLARVFNNFPKEYRSATYAKLVDLYKNEVEPIINERHDVVHAFTLKSKYYWGFIEKNRNIEELTRLQAEKENYPELFKHQLNCFFEGFSIATQLIAELPDKPRIVALE